MIDDKFAPFSHWDYSIKKPPRNKSDIIAHEH